MLASRSATSAVLLTTIVVLGSCSLPSYAIEIRGDRVGPVTIAAGETIDDTLVAFGDTVVIDGTIMGDLIAAARRVTITGTVNGDVISAARDVEIGGRVEGNIYSAGASVRLAGMAGRNIYGAGQSITLGEGTEIRGNMIAAGESITLEGQLGRDLMAAARDIQVRGTIGRSLRAYAQHVTLLPSARIAGDLRADVPARENVQIESGASIGGTTDIRVAPPRRSPYSTASFYVFQVVWLAAAFVTGLVLFWVFPFLSRPSLDDRVVVLKTGALGFVAAIATPVAALVAALTIVGIPIAVLTIVLWAFGLYLAKIVIAVFFGRALLSTTGTALPVALLAGLILVTVAVNLPYLGTLINIVVTLVGFGAVLMATYLQFRPTAATPAR